MSEMSPDGHYCIRLCVPKIGQTSTEGVVIVLGFVLVLYKIQLFLAPFLVLSIGLLVTVLFSRARSFELLEILQKSLPSKRCSAAMR